MSGRCLSAGCQQVLTPDRPPLALETSIVLSLVGVVEDTTMDQHPVVVAVLVTARRLQRIQRLEARCTVQLIRQLEELPVGTRVRRLANLLGSEARDPAVAFTTPIVDLRGGTNP